MPDARSHPFFTEYECYETPGLVHLRHPGDRELVRRISWRADARSLALAVLVSLPGAFLFVFFPLVLAPAVFFAVRGPTRGRLLREELRHRGIAYCATPGCHHDCSETASDRCPICDGLVKGKPRRPAVLCINPSCRYDCRGIPGRTCPECGSEVPALADRRRVRW